MRAVHPAAVYALVIRACRFQELVVSRKDR